jgi:hypothetical protein
VTTNAKKSDGSEIEPATESERAASVVEQRKRTKRRIEWNNGKPTRQRTKHKSKKARKSLWNVDGNECGRRDALNAGRRQASFDRVRKWSHQQKERRRRCSADVQPAGKVEDANGVGVE